MQKIITRYNLKDWKELVGWAGMLLILLSYICISVGALSSDNLWYFYLNTTGSAGLSLISFAKKTYQPALMNLVFVFIGFLGIIRILLN